MYKSFIFCKNYAWEGFLSELFQKIFGLKLPKIVIYTYDIKGILAKIGDIVAKENGNIKNIVQKDAEVMGTQEITLRVECKDVKKLLNP